MIQSTRAIAIPDVEPIRQPAYVAVGAFDGVHIGHQCLIQTLVHRAHREGAASVVITFDPIPKEYFACSPRPIRLTDASQRRRALKHLGVDRIVELQFDERLRRMEAAAFLRELWRRIGVRCVIVGRDFRFGAGASAGIEELKRFADATGFECSVFEDVEMLSTRISSTRIRHLVRGGQIAEATKLLGREFEVKWRIRTARHHRMAGGVQWTLDGCTSHCLPAEGRYLAQWRESGGRFSESHQVRGIPCVIRIYHTGDRRVRAIIEAGSNEVVPVPQTTCVLALVERLEPISATMQIGETEYGMDWIEEATTLMTVW